MKKTIAILLTLVMMVSLFAGCGKKADKSDQKDKTSSTASDTENALDENASGEIDDTSSNQDGTSSDASKDNATSSDGESSDSSAGNGNGTSSGKPSGTGSSKPSGGSATVTPTPSTMPAALKSLKGIEKYKNEPVDYSNPANWVSMPNTNKDVDVIFFYPTGYNAANGDDLSDIDDSGMLSMATISKIGQASVFEQSCNVYMPRYRQLTVNALLKYGNDENLTYCASFDIYRALDYYFQNKNNGKPFILAGHSQGSVWLSVILQDYMKKHPEYLKRMVAAYVIGFSVTKDYLKRNPHLKFATGATDTGVIISYNTEGPGNKGQTNIVVEKGAVAINPINWRTDSTYAPVSQNLGSINYATTSIGKGIADARVDTERGVVICTAVDKSYATAGFGAESYHAHDYSFYYGNLVKNVADRIAAYKKK